MTKIFYLPVNTDKPKYVAFLVFVCTTPLFIAQISSLENVSKRDAILAPVAIQWIAKDIPSYGSQSKRAKIAIHWFGKYEIHLARELSPSSLKLSSRIIRITLRETEDHQIAHWCQ